MIAIESSFPSTVTHKPRCIVESPGELSETADARTPPQTRSIHISDGEGGAQACVVL